MPPEVSFLTETCRFFSPDISPPSTQRSQTKSKCPNVQTSKGTILTFRLFDFLGGLCGVKNVG